MAKVSLKLSWNTKSIRRTTVWMLLLLQLSSFFGINTPISILSTSTASAATGVPLQINFQGRLTLATGAVGTNVANGTYAMRFKLYDALTSGTLLWTETYDQAPVDPCQKVQVTAGVFNVKLGSCATLSGVDFTSDSLYLSVDFAPTGTSYDGEMSPRKRLVSAPYAINANNLAGNGKIDLTNTATTTVPFKLTANTLTTASGLTLTTTSNSAANTAWTGSTLTFNNAQATTAVSTGSIAGLDIQFNQNTAIAGNNETAARINLKQNDSSSTDATVASLLDLANNDTATGNQITVTDALKINGANVTNGINLSGTFGTNLITATNFAVAQSGQITSGTLAGSGTRCLEANNTGVIALASGACSGTTTLQSAYGNDVDGGDATISLTTADDSIIITNPSSSGSDSTFVLKVDQAAGGAVDGLIVNNAGTGTLATLDASNASGNGVNIDVQSSSSSQYALNVTSNNGSTNGLYVRADGNVGLGTTTPDGILEIAGNRSLSAWGLNGAALQGTAGTFSDTSTAGAGTATNAAINSIGQSTLTSTNSITTTNAFGTYLAGAPISGTNQTLTNTSALYIAATATVDGAGGTPTNSYGAYINAQTGATNNYAAVLLGGNVGIGTASPTSGRLSILGAGTGSSTQSLNITDSGGSFLFGIRDDGAVSAVNNTVKAAGGYYLSDNSGVAYQEKIIYGDSQHKVYIGQPRNQELHLYTNNSSRIIITGTGNVGIGTSTIGAKVDIDVTDASSITTEQITLRTQNTAQTLTDGTTITNWRTNQLLAPTINGVAGGGTETVTNAATLYVDNAPSGSNITITNPYALWVDAGTTRLDGTLNLSSITGSTQCLNVDTNGNVSGTGSACGGTTTLQTAYGNDVDGSDATISLTTADDSIIITNPSSSGTDSTFTFKIDQAASGAVDALIINNAGTGTLGTFDATNSSGNGLSIDVQSSSASQYALKVTANNGASNALWVGGDGRVGIGDTSPASLFTVGSGDLFQINTTGQIGSQQAPVSDYLFALAGTTGNDHSRIIDITQANDSAEDSTVINIANTISHPGTLTTTRSIANTTTTLTPTAAVGNAGILTLTGNDNSISLTNIDLLDATSTLVRSNVRGNNISISGNPEFNDTSGADETLLSVYGVLSTVTVDPVLTNVLDATLATYSGYFTNQTTEATGNGSFSNSAYGIYSSASANLTTTGNTQHLGVYASAAGTAVNNYGLYVNSSGATNNYGVYIASPSASANNYALYSSASAQSYFGGKVGIGTTTPSQKLHVAGTSSDTTGTLMAINYPVAVTQAGQIGGLSIDLSANVTTPAAGASVIGAAVLTPSASTTSGAAVYTGYMLDSTGSITNGTAGSINWRGTSITLPSITQNSGGSVTASGVLLTTSAITTAGTEHAINIAASGVGAGTLNGINISNITAGAGTETAIKIGTGWDNQISGNGWSVDENGDLTVASCTGCGGGSGSLDSITAAVADDTNNDNTNKQIAWDWSTPTTQTAFKLQNTGTGLTSGSIFNVSSATTSTVATNGIVSLNATGNYSSTSNVGLLQVAANATTAGTVAKFSGTALTTGTGVYMIGGTAMTTGSLLQLASTTYNHGNATETGNLLNIAFTDATNGTATSTTNGINITPTINVTTGASGAKTINGIKISAPTLTACTGGSTCTYAGLNVDTSGTLANTTIYPALFNGGNVGIGTTAPANLLSLYKSAATAAVQITSGTVPINTGATAPGTGGDDATVGTISWSGTSNISSSNDSYASASITTGQVTHYLTATNLGLSVPATATIVGVSVDVERSVVCGRGCTNGVVDNSVKLFKGGAVTGSDKATGTTWPTSDTVATYGGASDMWGASLTPSDVNASNFGVGVSATTSNGGTPQVDYITVTVYYTDNTTWLAGTNYSNSGSFQVSQNSSFGTADYLTLTTSGRVGIGTTTPSSKVDIVSTNTATNSVQITASSTTTGSGIALTGPTSTGVTTGTTSGFLKVTSDVGSAGTAGTLAYFAPDYSAGSATSGYGVTINATDSTSSGNTNFNIYNNLTLTGNAAKTAYGYYSDINTASTTADTLYGSYIRTSAASAAALSTGTRNNYGYVADVSDVSNSTSGTHNLYGFHGTVLTASIQGGTTNAYGGYFKANANHAADAGTVNTYGLYIANDTAGVQTNGTSNKYGLYVEAQTSADNNYAAIFAGGNVGIGDTTPASLLTVGSGDLFQINTTGEIGAQVSPNTDYLFGLTGSTSKDYSRIIDIIQGNDAGEDTTVFNIVNTSNTGTVSTGTRNIANADWSLTPTMTLTAPTGVTTGNINGIKNAVSLANVTLGDSSSGAARTNLNTNAESITLTVNPTINDTVNTVTNTINAFGSNISVSGSPTLTSLADLVNFNTAGINIQNSVSSAGDASLINNAYGIKSTTSGNLGTTSGSESHYAGYFDSSGTAVYNYGLFVNQVASATNNYGLYIGSIATSASNYSIYSSATAQSYLAGNLGIGTIAPAQKLHIQDGSQFINLSSSFTPTTLAGGFDTSGQNINTVFVSGKYAYVGQSTNAGTCSGTTVTGCEFSVWDIHNPNNPIAVSGINIASTVKSIYVSGRYAYIGRIADAGTCTTSTITGCEFMIYDISNPNSPSIVSVDGGFNQDINSIFVQGKLIFVAANTDNSTGTELKIYDLSNPTTLAVIGSINTGDATSGEGAIKSVYVQGRYMYLGLSSTTGTGCTSGDATSCDFRIYDINDPFNPTFKGGANTGADVNTVSANGKYAYLGSSTDGSTNKEFDIYNIADPTAPTETAGINYDVTVQSIQIQGKYAYIGRTSASGNDFRILDITDPTATPVDAGGSDITFDVKSVFISGKYAYIGIANTATTAKEMRVLDIAGIDTPTITTGTAGVSNLQVTDSARIDSDLHVAGSVNVGLGGIQSSGPISIENTLQGNSSGNGVAGIYGNYTFNNTTSSVFQYGNRFISNITAVEDSNVDSTYIGQLIRIVDSDCDTGATALDCDNTVRGLEVQSWTGNNTAGTNTAIAGFGKTFGIQGTTDALAGGVSQPAAVFADLDNGSAATVGNAIRAYTNNATSADLVSFYQETTAYTGTGLLMNFGNNSGSFVGNFIDLQKAGSSKFKINYDGTIITQTISPTGSIIDYASGTNGNTFIWKIPQKATTGTCATATAEGMIFQNTGGTQVGHICIDGPTSGTPNKLRFYAEQFNATSTDLAENYSDVTGTLQAGEVVSFDITTNKAITKATAENTEYLAGIVSTAPGLLLTDASEDGTPTELINPKPLAISGRVPVKVSDENGIVKKGDHLTASLTKPGFAMKATKAGTTLGQAISDSKDGYVTVFVNLSTWNGEKSGLPKTIALTTEDNALRTDFLKTLESDNSGILSELFTDRVVAKEVVSSKVFTTELSVSKLNFTEGSGLDLDNAVVLKGGLKVDSIGSINELLTIQSSVEFIGTPYFNKDSAGFAKIIAGTKEIRVEFETEYLVKPIVTANLSFERDESTREDDQIKNEELDIMAAFSGVQYVIVNKNTKGFTILLNKKAPRDLTFSWISLAVKEANTFVSKDLTAQQKAQEEQNQENITNTDSKPEIVGEKTEESPTQKYEKVETDEKAQVETPKEVTKKE